MDNKISTAFFLIPPPSCLFALLKLSTNLIWKETKWENKKETKLCLSIFSPWLFLRKEKKNFFYPFNNKMISFFSHFSFGVYISLRKVKRKSRTQYIRSSGIVKWRETDKLSAERIKTSGDWLGAKWEIQRLV